MHVELQGYILENENSQKSKKILEKFTFPENQECKKQGSKLT